MSTHELQTQGDYVLRLDVTPFTPKEVKVTLEDDEVRVRGFRGEYTQVNKSFVPYSSYFALSHFKYNAGKLLHESLTTVYPELPHLGSRNVAG